MSRSHSSLSSSISHDLLAIAIFSFQKKKKKKKKVHMCVLKMEGTWDELGVWSMKNEIF